MDWDYGECVINPSQTNRVTIISKDGCKIRKTWKMQEDSLTPTFRESSYKDTTEEGYYSQSACDYNG